MKRLFLILTMLTVLTACGGQAQAPVPTVDVNATIASLSGTMMAGTLTAQPTQTPLPTSTFTPEPTATLPPFYGEFAPAGLPDGVNKGYVLFENETKIKPVHLNFQGTTLQGERPYYYKQTFEERQHRFNPPLGTYTYVIYLGDKKMFSGSLRLTGPDKTTFFIRDDKVVISGP